MFDLVYGNLLPDPDFDMWSKKGAEYTAAHLYSFLKNNPNMVGADIHILWDSEKILYIEPEWKAIIDKIHPVTFTDISPDKTNIIHNNFHTLCITDTLITSKIDTTRHIRKVAIVVHLYYYEFWHEIYTLMQNIPRNIDHDIYVYIPDDHNAKDSRLKATEILNKINSLDQDNIFAKITPNRGRDIGSFLQFICEDRWRMYDAICKVHTKITKSISPTWREDLLHALLGADNINTCINSISSGSSKMTGCNKHLISSSNKRFKLSKQNRVHVISLCERFNLQPVEVMKQWAFYAGTMFWTTPGILHKIQQQYGPYMTSTDGEYINHFPEEPLPNNNTIVHGWERFFGILAELEGGNNSVSMTPLPPIKTSTNTIVKTAPVQQGSQTHNDPAIQKFLDSLPYTFEHDTYCQLYPDLPTGYNQALKHLRRAGVREGRIYNMQQLEDKNAEIQQQIQQEYAHLDNLKPDPHERLINILVRTHSRPNLFKKCIESILAQQYSNYKVYVCVQDDEDMNYTDSIDSDKLVIIRGVKTTEKPYFFNDFSNQLLTYITDGWVMFLDDDDKLSHTNALAAINSVIEEDSIIFWKYRRPDSIIIPDITESTLTRGTVTSVGYCFHNKYIQDNKWAVKRQGDFDFISKLYTKIPNKELLEYTLNEYQITNRIASFGNSNIDVQEEHGNELKGLKCQVCTHPGLAHLEDRLKRMYNLTSYTDPTKPCLFFGFYTPDAIDKLQQHTGDRYIMFGGTDCNFKYKNICNNVSRIKRLGYKKCFSLSKDMKQRLDGYSVSNTLINFNLVDTTLFYPRDKKGDSIFIYNGLNGSDRGETYGEDIYTQVVKNLPGYTYIYSNQLYATYEQMPDIYAQCFIGLRLTPNDGNANMVQEMKAMNLPVIHNQSDYGLKWTNIDDIYNYITQYNPIPEVGINI